MSVLTKEVRYHKSMSSQLMFYFAVLRSRNNPKLLEIHKDTETVTLHERTCIMGTFSIDTFYQPCYVCCDDFY